MNNLKFIIALLFVTSVAFSQNSDSKTVTVQIDNIKNAKGQLVVGLYSNPESFLKTPSKGEIVKIKGSSATVVFKNVTSGTYAVSLFHDENSNEKLDTNFMGIPKESFASSNNAKGFMGPPKWEDAKFEVKDNFTVKIKF
ncbi:DUF2141 domain-containing protein [Paucihalobacter sp.]|uniref:DUF2141 domain-containing protein n=1 Tax=Paucihalobacter sp. TaxID=2850405 RepID=UPI003D161676